jgi:MYXO-CTERM domain-containing protein
MRARGLFLAAIALVLLAPVTASAAVWGSFDGTRVNYAGGVLTTGADHDDLRAIIAANGDTLAPATGSLTAVYLAGVDVFYTSLLNTGAPVLSLAEQAALQAWVVGGGTLVVTGDIFPLPFYESFTAQFGITGWAQTGAGTAVPSGAMHTLTAGVVSIDQITQSTFTFGLDALELLTADDGNPFMIVLEPATGFCLGGRIVVLGDHNLFSDGGIGLADNTTLATNLVEWAALPDGGCGPCGNGMLDPGEGCDDGNFVGTDACPNTCQPAFCGDGFAWAGMEACDDGNLDDTDACTTACAAASCGDGYVWAGMEGCDDGNGDNGDACPVGCEPASCGDGFVHAGQEECDDGNDDDTDACSNACEIVEAGSTGAETGEGSSSSGGVDETGGSGGGSGAQESDGTGGSDGGATEDADGGGSTDGGTSPGVGDGGGCGCVAGEPGGERSWWGALALMVLAGGGRRRARRWA